MRKPIILTVVLIFVTVLCAAADLCLEMKANCLVPAEKAFRDIYGSGAAFGLAAGLRLNRNLELSLEGTTFSADGELSYTGEATDLSLTAFGVDLKYVFPFKGVDLYLGPGVYLHHFKESNRLGTVKKNGLGVKVKGGVLIALAKSFRLNVFAGYSFCKMAPADFRIAIGGFEAGLGLRYRF